MYTSCYTASATGILGLRPTVCSSPKPPVLKQGSSLSYLAERHKEVGLDSELNRVLLESQEVKQKNRRRRNFEESKIISSWKP
jgi:hypothetical protein